MIPKIIHYCWFGGKELPTDVKSCISSWQVYCPDYEIKRWDENNFDVKSHPFMNAAFQSSNWAFVSDYARLKIIYEYGGIYLDTDVELIHSLDSLLDNKCYIGIQQNEKLCNTGLGFGAEKNNVIIKKMMDVYDEIVFDETKKNTFACPWLNDKILTEIGYQHSNEVEFLEDITIYPPRFFDPYPSGKGYDLMCEDTFSSHHYAATWTSGANRWKRKVVRIVGEKNFMRLKRLLKR